jgi:hypothetical protein
MFFVVPHVPADLALCVVVDVDAGGVQTGESRETIERPTAASLSSSRRSSSMMSCARFCSMTRMCPCDLLCCLLSFFTVCSHSHTYVLLQYRLRRLARRRSSRSCSSSIVSTARLRPRGLGRVIGSAAVFSEVDIGWRSVHVSESRIGRGCRWVIDMTNSKYLISLKS